MSENGKGLTLSRNQLMTAGAVLGLGGGGTLGLPSLIELLALPEKVHKMESIMCDAGHLPLVYCKHDVADWVPPQPADTQVRFFTGKEFERTPEGAAGAAHAFEHAREALE